MSLRGCASSAFDSLRNARHQMNADSLMVLALGLICVAVPLELGQLTFAFVGAVAYALVQATRSSTKAKVKNAKGNAPRGKIQFESDSEQHYKRALRPGGSPVRRGAQGLDRARPDRPDRRDRDRDHKKEPKVDYRQPSAQPVLAPTFVSDAFETQVEELVRQIAPSPRGDQLMKELAASARALLQKMIPEAEVVAFASADITRGTAFGVAVPEVDIICNASPSVLAECLQNRTERPIPHAAKLDARKLHKSALRACTDELVAGGVFKFRRSAFKGLEPKVTLLATGFGATAIPVDFSVNTLTPLYNAALLTECGQIDTRARDLILLVRRWGKDRGVSHAAKGHLSPYAWSLLAIYFLQVWDTEGEPILPTLTAFKLSSGLLPAQQATSQPSPSSGTAPRAQENVSKASVASLFKGFVRFYARTMNWRREAVSVRAGKRQAPSAKLPLHIVELSNGSTEVAPSIEDPFEPTRNLSTLMTSASLVRFREEFARADGLCSKDASLSELLEPWVPPERGSTADEVCGEE